MQCAKLGCRPDFTTHVGRTGLTPTVSRLDSRLTYRERPDAAGTWRLARIDLPRGRVRSEQRQVSKISGGFYDEQLYIEQISVTLSSKERTTSKSVLIKPN